MRNTAQVVIIGGGISGCSIAYNLAKKGVRDIVVIEKNYLASGLNFMPGIFSKQTIDDCLAEVRNQPIDDCTTQNQIDKKTTT